MSDRRRFAWVPNGLIALAVTVTLLASADGYGYHRDELYFRMLHPDWGYADQPPFTPLLDHASIAVFGDHLWSARVVAAIFAGVAALLMAAIAREAGGGAGAQALSASSVFGTFTLAAAHVNATAITDLLVWLAVLFFVLRALLHGQEKAWLAAGAVTGFGLYNKLLIVMLLACLTVAVLLVGPRSILRSRWLWLGLAAAVVIGSPNLIYQVVEGFPQAHMAGAIKADKGVGDQITLLPFQLVLLGPPMVPVWIAGLVVAWRDRRIRAIALTYLLLLVVVFVTGGQPYYPLAMLMAISAIGSVPTMRWLAGHRARKAWLVAGVALSVVTGMLFALPIIAPDRLGVLAQINPTLGDQIGWPEYVSEVAAVYTALPAADRSRAVLFTSNYGEAGALDRFGPRYGLPSAYSGQNELFKYGPPPDAKTVVIVVFEGSTAYVKSRFGTCDEKATLHNRAGVQNEEVGAGVYVCRNLPVPWHSLWPELQHFD